MNAPDLPRWKLFEIPLLSLGGSSVDVSPMVGLALLFLLAFVGLVFARRKAPWRYATLGLSSFLFVLAVHRTMCVLRGWIFGVQILRYDDLLAFTYLHVAAGLVAIAFVGGGIFCGWMCPVGAIQELTGRGSAWLKTRMGRTATRSFDVVLTAFAIVAVGWLLWHYGSSNFFFSENVSALYVLVGLVVLLLVVFRPHLDRRLRGLRSFGLVTRVAIILWGIWTTNPGCTLYENELDYSSLISLVGVFLASVVLTRAYCRYVCPFGALFGWIAPHALLKIEAKEGGCARCHRCDGVCPTGALRDGVVDPASCILCGRCVDRCGHRVTLTIHGHDEDAREKEESRWI